MQWHYNEHCLGLGRQALILHGSHRELEAFKNAEGPCYHSHPEVLALLLLSKRHRGRLRLYHHAKSSINKKQRNKKRRVSNFRWCTA